MENYVKYKLVGGKLKLKEGVVPHKFACQKQTVEKPERSVVKKLKIAKLITSSSECIASTSHDVEEIYIVDSIPQVQDIVNDPLNDVTRDENVNSTEEEILKTKHKKIQVNLRKKVCHKSTETDNKYFHLRSTDKKQSKIKKQNQLEDKPSTSSFEEYSISTNTYSYRDVLDETDITDSEADFDNESFKTHMQKAALLCVSREPQMLLGIPKQWYCCIQLLSESSKCSPRDVMVVLKKIRVYQTNAALALDFGITKASVGIIFRKNIPIISSCLKSLVFFPKSTQVVANIPMSFRKRYSNVKSIIDCLEIQIEKPTEAAKQALTWSEYKSCNTMKYLISITPDGLINFISEGYGGRASDSIIFEDCGFLNLLPKNSAVMADRGFKNVAHLLQQKECTLIRPPSVSTKVTPTKSEVLETKKIAALRIHVERAIGRLRNFGFLIPHATVDLKHVDLLDYVMMTACGIVNLHNSLFNFKK